MVAGLTVTSSIVVTAAAVAAGPSRPASTAAPAASLAALAPPSPDLPGLPSVSLELSQVAVDSADFRDARSEYDSVDATLTARQTERVGIDLGRTATTATQASREVALAAARARAASLTSRLDQVDRAIAEIGVRMFTTGNGVDRVDAALTEDQPSINDQDRRHVLAQASLDVLLAEQVAYRARLTQVTEMIEEAEADLTALTTRAADLEADRPDASEAEIGAAGPVAEERVDLEHARVLADVEGVEFALVALDAYYRAARTMAEEKPACGVRWWAIAGVSRVEGRHGTYGGAQLMANGDQDRRIVGIQLNGTRATRVITDTDGGAYDGDPVYDRAVGPMQFIPSTWRRFAADGNGDAVEDPFNLYDATLAAARYLCHSRSGLHADEGLRAAYFSYNHSLAYVANVLGYARLYESSLDVPEPAPAVD